ncbi:agrin isoform X12 [Argonauta hians]
MKKYNEMIPVDPCDSYFCAFGAECYVNNTNTKPYCKCMMRCNNNISPVCGTDRVSYTNECHLKKFNCLKKKRVKVLFTRACGDYFKTSRTVIFRQCRRCWPTAAIRHFYKLRNRNRSLQVAVNISRILA